MSNQEATPVGGYAEEVRFCYEGASPAGGGASRERWFGVLPLGIFFKKRLLLQRRGEGFSGRAFQRDFLERKAVTEEGIHLSG